MSTRVVDIEKPYEGGTAIEVTQDKVINLRLRSENNLIIYDEGDNEIYVDLQLPSDIEPADAIPVGINTGRVLAADGWDYTGTIVVFKTTSGDNIKLLYADNGRVFIDNGTGTFKEIYLKGDVDALISGLRSYIDDELAKKQDKLTAGANITIAEDPQTHELVISSTGGGGASYTAGTGIDIDANNVISVDSTYIGGYIPRSNPVNPDNLADNALYYGEYFNQGAITSLGLSSDQVVVRANIDIQNSHNAYLEYYNNVVDLYLSDTVSGTRTTAMYKSTGIESTAGGTTETFEFQGNGNDKIARLSDLSGYVLQSGTTQNVLSYTNSSKTVDITTSYMGVSTSSQSASIGINSSSNGFLFLGNKNSTGSRINMDGETLEYYGATSATNATYSFAEGSANQIAKVSDIPTVVTYTAGDNVQINNGVISATDTTYYAGEGIDIGQIPLLNSKGPAPVGFHVPSNSEWTTLCGVLTNNLGLAGNITTIATYLKMPSAGYRKTTSGDVGGLGNSCYYWSVTNYNKQYAYNLFSNASYILFEYDYKCGGKPIRCFKDSPVKPDNSWTMLYDGSSVAGGAGVFHNASLGLISISGDGTTWYTIADKNLGATTVYNSGDTLSEANCGGYFQWGNSYMFPFTGSVTTSSNTVDAGAYGPGNYYSSSTFILGDNSIGRNRWDSSNNSNLWGGDNPSGIQGYIDNVISVDSTVALKSDVSVVSGDSNTYSIVVSSSAPASGTPNTTLTFVV